MQIFCNNPKIKEVAESKLSSECKRKGIPQEIITVKEYRLKHCDVAFCCEPKKNERGEIIEIVILISPFLKNYTEISSHLYHEMDHAGDYYHQRKGFPFKATIYAAVRLFEDFSKVIF